MMPGLFYPYRNAADALAHLGPYADASVGRGCGISFSDGRQVSVLRRPAGSQHLWLNVWSRHVSAPRPAAVAHGSPSTLHRIEHFFESAMEMYDQSQIQEAQANQAAAQAAIGFVDRNVYEPAHAWLAKHKLFADVVGVVADVVGVVAGVVVICMAGPEIALGAAIVGGTAILGSLVLTAIDGTVLGFELAGNEDRVKAIEGNEAVQWARIIGTVMTLPDMAVGGVQAVRDVTKLPSEINEAKTVSRTLTEAAEAQRAKAAKIAHPAKHPHKVQQRLTRAKRLTAEATTQAKRAHHAGRELMAAKLGIVGSYGATPTGAGLMAASPPDVLKSQQQKHHEARRGVSITPDGGMPRDVRLDMRVSGVSPGGHR